jgi:hypothetical protein
MLIATPGAVDANSYATVAQAQEYVDTLMSGVNGWADASTALKEGALQTATRLIDATFRWLGLPTYVDQALGFPRSGLTLNAQNVNSLTIPRQIKDATSEFARFLLIPSAPESIISDAAQQGIESVKAGSVEVQFTKMEQYDRRLLPIPAYVVALIPSQWYEGGAGAIDNGDETNKLHIIFDTL